MLVLAGFAIPAYLAMSASPSPARAAEAVNEVYPVPYGGVYILDGHGFGHGIGLSQWGAEYGAEQGATYQEILSHYYYGTTLGSDNAPRDIRVLITEAAANLLIVQQVSGLSITDAATGESVSTHCAVPNPTDVVRWGVAAAASGNTVVQQLYAYYSSGYYHCLWPFTGPITFAASAGVTEQFPDTSTRTYDGQLAAVTTSASSVAVVNTLPLENYVAGVVPNESPASWPAAALEAQAVAARSYALEHYSSSAKWDICDSTFCQVYAGKSSETSATDNATSATTGEVLYYGGSVILAMYSASNGGYSVYGNEPYLLAQPDAWDVGSPEHDWTVRVSASTIADLYPQIGQLRDVTVTSRDGNGDWGGRILGLTLDGSTGSVSVSGPALSGELGLMSNWWTVDPATYSDSFASGYTPSAAWQGSTQFTLAGRSAAGGVAAATWLQGSGWQAPRSLGGEILGAPTVAVTPDGALDALAVGTNSQAYIRSVSSGGWESLGGSLSSPVSGVSWTAGTFTVFARGANGALWSRTWHSGWGAWADLGGQLINGTGAAVISPSAGHVAVFVSGLNDMLYERDFGPAGWSRWYSLAATVAGTPAAAFGDGRGELFVRQGTEILVGTWHPDQPTRWWDLGTGFSSDPGAAAVATTLRVDVVAWSGGNLMSRTWNGSAWTAWGQLF